MNELRTYRTEEEMMLVHAEERALMRGSPKTIAGITLKACAETGIGLSEITGPYRDKRLVMARHPLWHHLNKRAGFSLNEIGAYFNRDHTTILHGVQKIEKGLNK